LAPCAFPISTRCLSLRICRTAAFPRPVHLRPCCVSGLKGQLHQPGMKCQVRRPQCPVALQGQPSAGPCRVMGGTRGECVTGRWWVCWCRARPWVAANQVPASTRTPARTRQSRATGQRVAGARLRAGLTGRGDPRAGLPGLHPGLVELALQAEIARGPVRLSGVRSMSIGR
jgi:hypothetical protein